MTKKSPLITGIFNTSISYFSITASTSFTPTMR